ncbi:MAG: Adaptive-response sensory-kinase SasA [Rhodocyclaceae bacterium]|nr:Adaptive-response sensory-kinase SasA [Rhodocyclaceae bacterium]
MTDKSFPRHDYRHALLRDENTLRFLRLIVGLMLASSATYLAAALLFSDHDLLRSSGAVAAFASGVVALALIRKGRLEQGVQLLVWGVWLSVLLQVSLSNGLMSRSLIAFPIIIMLGGWLLTPRGTLALCLATLLAGAALAAGEQAGLLPLYASPSPPLLVWLAFSIYIVLSATLAFFIFRGFRRHHRTMHRLGDHLRAQFNTSSAREAELHLVMESVPVMLFHGDRDKRCLYANRSYRDFYAAGQKNLAGLSVREIIGAANYDGNPVEATLERVLAGERIAYRASRKSTNGDLRMLDIVMIPEPDAAGGTRGFFALFRDVTEEVRAEAALRSSEEKFTKVFHASPVAISISRMKDGLYLDVNDAFVEQFGWAREEMLGHSSVDIGLWPSRAERERWTAELSLAGRTRNRQTTLRTKAGALHTVIVSAERIVLGGEECIVGLVHDITERLQAETALQEREARLREAQRIGHFGSWELLIPSQRMSFSDELCRIYEIGQSGFGGTWQDLLGMVHPEDLPVMQEIWRKAGRGEGKHVLRHRIRMSDGRVKHLLVRFEVFRDANGHPVHALGTAQDVTEQVLAREEVQRLNDELEARVAARTAELTAANRELESFAYSISHDLRAPLRGIDGFSHLLAEEYAERLDDTGRGYLERVRRAAQRMGTLIDDILELSRVTRQEMRRVKVDLSQLAAELLEERARSEPGRQVALSIAPECIAYGDPQLLRVLMQNLIENAWKYTRRTDPARIAFGTEKVSPGETAFFVRDNGVGFDMQYAGRLFTPFQRLHKPEEFEGTGIGLATVARIAHRHGGRIWAEASPNQGATFRFTLGQTGKM